MQEFNPQNNNPEWNQPPQNFNSGAPNLIFGWQTEITEPSVGDTAELPFASLAAAEVSGPVEESTYVEEPMPVPGDHFDLAQFADQGFKPGEEAVVNAIDHHIFPKAAEKYPDFVFPSGNQDAIELNYQFPSGDIVRVKVFASGNMHVRSKEDMYVYHGLNKTFHRHDNPAEYTNLPKPGEAPTEVFNEIAKEKFMEEAPVRKLAAELGDGPPEVGWHEMAYISGIAANAEPQRVTAYQILERTRTRSRSPLQPSDEAAIEAVPYFERSIQHFVDQNSQATSLDAMTVTGDGIDPLDSNTSMHIRAGRQWDESDEHLTPFMELYVDRTFGPEGIKDQAGRVFGIGGGKAQEVVRYTVRDGKLQVTKEQRRLDNDGDVDRELPPHVTNAEMEDVKLVAHFLRDPILSPRRT